MPFNPKDLSFSRRELLQASGKIALTAFSLELLACSHLLVPTDSKTISTPENPRQGLAIAKRSADPFVSPHRLEHGPCPSALIFASFDGLTTHEIALPFYPHQVCQNPVNHAQTFTVQKWGCQGASIHFPTGNVSLLQAPAGHLFFGHAAFSPDGEFIFISSMNFKEPKGEILVYRTRDLSLQHILPSGGMNPHDLQISHDQKSLFVINENFSPSAWIFDDYKNMTPAKGSLNQIDLTTLETIKTVDLHSADQDSAAFQYGHFLNKNDRDFLLLGVSDRHTVLSSLKEGHLVQMSQDPLVRAYSGETLSVCAVGDDKALVTMPATEQTFLVDLTQDKVLKAFHLKNCKALIPHPDQEHVLIFYGSHSTTTFAIFSKSKMDLLEDTSTLASLRLAVESHSPRGSHGSVIQWPT